MPWFPRVGQHFGRPKDLVVFQGGTANSEVPGTKELRRRAWVLRGRLEPRAAVLVGQ